LLVNEGACLHFARAALTQDAGNSKCHSCCGERAHVNKHSANALCSQRRGSSEPHKITLQISSIQLLVSIILQSKNSPPLSPGKQSPVLLLLNFPLGLHTHWGLPKYPGRHLQYIMTCTGFRVEMLNIAVL
jgi:hypothetical protein